MDQLSMFALNIRLLIGILVCLLASAILAVFIYTMLRVAHSSRAARKSLNEFENSRLDAHGNRLPPTGMGICHTCGQAYKQVFFLPDGSKCCPACYEPTPSESGHDQPEPDDRPAV